MRNSPRNVIQHAARFLALTFGLLAVTIVQAGSFNLNVVDPAGAPVNGFRWLLQEDTTYHPEDPNPDAIPPTTGLGDSGNPDILAFNFHKSYNPPAGDFTTGAGLQGNAESDSTGTISNVIDGHYYLSVLPYAGYSISGKPVKIDGGAGTQTVTVTVQKHPIPTAQIAIYVFHDNFSINGAPDLPQEANPADGEPGYVDWTQFSLFLEEPAGRYGIAGGQVIQDAFGNPLGTTYEKGCDADGQPDVDPNTNYGCFDVDGAPIVVSLGDGTLHPNADGTLLVENLVPGKYGIIMIPPTASNWQQTSTIEGSKVIDAWVKAKEPPFFVEFGPPAPHAFVGFVKSTTNGGFPALVGGPDAATVEGTIKSLHLSRPPAGQFFNGRPFPECWVGLNDAGGQGLYAEPCDADSGFSIDNINPGNYQLVIFDTNLFAIINLAAFTVDATGGTCNGGASCNFGDVGVFEWFTRLNTGVFNDDDQDGFWDDNEIGIGPESQDVSLRWRDGTIYQNFPTDNDGLAPFDGIFPFFHWLVAEVSFGNKKATGVTYVIDGGGEVLADNGWAYPSFDELTPQAQACTASDLGVTVDEVTNVGPDGLCYTADDTVTLCAVVDDPIINCNTGNNLSRTETGPSLTTGFQGFAGQTQVMQFGKTDYVGFDFSTPMPTYVGENGGISGIVFNTTTRAENEPQFAAAEEWEPGVPSVQVNLYADGDIDSYPLGDFSVPGVGDIDWDNDGVLDGDDNIADDIDGNGCVGLADVDNYPLDNFPGPEDVDRGWQDDDLLTNTNTCTEIAGNNLFDLHDAVQVTWTDSWDDSLPTGCQGEIYYKFGDASLPTDCYDGLRNWNQVRPGVFDGGYAFVDYDLGYLASVNSAAETAIQDFYDCLELGCGGMPGVSNFERLQLGLLPGDYIVEAAAPTGYGHIKEADRNIDFGDEYIPSPEALPVACVGDDHEVPPLFTMLTKDGSGLIAQAIPGVDTLDPGNAAPFAGDMRPLCDRKKVPLSSGQNAAAEFFLKTDANVPLAANISGTVLNDLANEFDPNSPALGEKYALPWVPVAFYDWNGAELNRVYGDEYGRFNAMVASTFTANIGMPSGMSPNMLQACINDAGAIPDGSGGFILDPNYDPAFSQFCYTLQYMPGTITYLDTPVVSIAAFSGSGLLPQLDCEQPAQTPVISSVSRAAVSGGGGPFALAGQQIEIHSMGLTEVPNPEWDGSDTGRNIMRDYSFICGGLANAEIEDASGTRTALGSINCTAGQIDGIVPAVGFGDYQVVVTGSDGTESPIGVTLTVGSAEGVGQRPDGNPYAVHNVATGGSIQAAIDAAAAGDLILVAPGSYDEMVIMWKPVKLQGWGAGEVFINARPVPTEKRIAWRNKAEALVDGGDITPLPGQAAGVPGFPALVDGTFPSEEGAAIFVAGVDAGAGAFGELANQGARIDGFTILAAGSGGGIVVNGYAQDLLVGNNRVTGNAGSLGGGVRVGHPTLSHTILDITDPQYDPAANGGAGNIGDIVYDDATNDRIRIHHNLIVKNGGFGGAGGGISLHTGADDYQAQSNWVCGNFTQGDGAGIGHLGLSDNGLMEDNVVAFNESFSQGSAVDGGGIFIGGLPDLMPDETVAPPLALTPGTGNVTVDANLLRGNLAGAGDGGGISLRRVNGEDVNQSPADTSPWWSVQLYNNGINNNVAGLAGGGITLLDALKVDIRNNTVANNDSVATAGLAFAPASPNASTPQPAGIVSRVHTPDLAFEMAADVTVPVPADWLVFSDPDLQNVIAYNNRSFYWLNYDDPLTPELETGLFPASCADPIGNGGAPGCDVNNVTLFSDDLAVLDGSVLTANLLNPLTSLLTNTSGYDPSNVQGDPSFVNPVFNTHQSAAAFDEGGNFINVHFSPLSLLEYGAQPDPADNTTYYDYHIAAPSFAINTGGNVPAGRLSEDFDNDLRPNGGFNDIGADEGGGPAPLADSDADGVSDVEDNCIDAPNNPDAGGNNQLDTDNDGFGNMCDADLDQSGYVDFADLTLFSAAFFSADPDADLDGSGYVDFGDLTIFSGSFFQSPGPAAP